MGHGRVGCIGTTKSQSGNEYANGGIIINDGADQKLTFLSSVYRLNTYPLVHLGFTHVFLNTVALVPLLDRFEADHGTLLTAALFLGRGCCSSPN